MPEGEKARQKFNEIAKKMPVLFAIYAAENVVHQISLETFTNERPKGK